MNNNSIENQFVETLYAASSEKQWDNQTIHRAYDWND